MVFAVFLVIAAMIFLAKLLIVGSAFIISAAPLCFAAMIGISSSRINGWLAFAFWVILLYSLASYPRLRKSVVFLSISFIGMVIVSIVTLLFESKMPESAAGQIFVRLLLSAICAGVALYVDSQKDDIFYINVAQYITLPNMVQRILVAIMNGFGVGFMVLWCVDGVIHSGKTASLVGDIFVIIAGVVSFLVEPAFSQALEE